MTQEELGPCSRALLDIVNETFGYIPLWDGIVKAARKTGARRSDLWWFRLLVALVLEGHIEGVVLRDGDDLSFNFRRKES